MKIIDIRIVYCDTDWEAEGDDLVRPFISRNVVVEASEGITVAVINEALDRAEINMIDMRVDEVNLSGDE